MENDINKNKRFCILPKEVGRSKTLYPHKETMFWGWYSSCNSPQRENKTWRGAILIHSNLEIIFKKIALMD